MSKWLILDPVRLNIGKADTLNGVRVNLYLAPSQIPEAVRGGFDTDTKRFAIEFKYMGEPEALIEHVSTDTIITLQLGKISKRIFRILIDAKTANASAIELTIKGQSDFRRAIKDRMLQEIKSNAALPRNVSSVALTAINSSSENDLFEDLKVGL